MKWIGDSWMRQGFDLTLKLGSLVLLFWIILSRVDLASIKGRVDQLSLWGALMVTVLFAFHAALSAVRWRVVTIHLGGSMDFRTALSGSLIERFVNQAIPSFVGGDGARILELVRSGESARVAAYSGFVDRLFSFGGAFGLVLLFLPLSLSVVSAPGVRTLLLLVSILAAFGIATLLLPPVTFWTSLARYRLTHYPSRIAMTLRNFLMVPGSGWLTVGLSLGIQALLVVSFLILASDLKIGLRPEDALALVPLITLAPLAVPISLAGWGIREGAAAVLLSTAGITNSDAVALSLVFGLAYLATSCLGGIIWLIMHVVSRQRSTTFAK